MKRKKKKIKGYFKRHRLFLEKWKQKIKVLDSTFKLKK